MISPFELHVALRYLRSRRASRLLSLITVIAVGGVTVGVMALIVVLGVMNGLQADLRDKILVANPHLRVLTYGEGLKLDDWRECLSVCLDAQFLCARRAAPIMKGQRSGSIVNISSTAGLYGYGLHTPYAAAKWAVIGFTKSLAVELGPYEVRANAICPGSVDGARMERVAKAEAESRGISLDLVRKEYLQSQSIKRFVKPEEIADMCLFLASPAAKMVTGQAIAVDGHTETFHIGS